MPLKKDFWDKVDRRDGPDACWPFTGRLDLRGGYGTLWWNDKKAKAHRLAYQFATGESIDGLFVCHRCDNPKCCNPSHLFLGTSTDNNLDMVNKRRHCFGVKSPAAKLTDADAKEILASGAGTCALAEKYGVSPALVSGIRHGNRWKHVGDTA